MFSSVKLFCLFSQIEECSDEKSLDALRDLVLDVLVTAKFSKVLNLKTKSEALAALHQHYGFNQYMAAIRQFMEGKIYIQKHNILPGVTATSAYYSQRWGT